MAKYDVTYSCGHEERVVLFGPSRERDRKIEWMEREGVCAECWQRKLSADRASVSAEAAKAAEEEGLPKLQGSEKQIAWAEKIRADQLRVLNDSTERRLTRDEEDKRELVFALVDRIHRIESAKWWIDNRSDSFHIYDICREIYYKAEKAGQPFDAALDAAYRDTLPTQEPASEIQTAEIDAKAEATVRPESPLTETVAEIKVLENAIEVHFPERREDFRELVRFKLGYTWTETRWRRDLKITNGTVTDRAVELGNSLLAAGFCVRIFDEGIRLRAISGEFEHECKRWVYRYTGEKYTGWFALRWPRGEDFFKVAKRLPGSRWNKPYVVVPPEQFEQVLDFAEMYEFRLTSHAQAVVEEARRLKETTLTAEIVAPKKSKSRKAQINPGSLPVPENVQVADEFKD